MANYVSGPILAVKGLVVGVIGKAKELIGTVLGRGDVTSAARAQQDRGDALRDAGKKETEAQKARATAKAQEERERANQSSRNSSG
ncbi:MAG: CsbD family protein [Mycobacteriaceae bacterium]|nr:CsbD family protein [Mycobacteriaceae bacterium]MBV9640921.1 CsbD family protein [Mycobacteriaceae bacterium]